MAVGLSTLPYLYKESSGCWKISMISPALLSGLLLIPSIVVPWSTVQGIFEKDTNYCVCNTKGKLMSEGLRDTVKIACERFRTSLGVMVEAEGVYSELLSPSYIS